MKWIKWMGLAASAFVLSGCGTTVNALQGHHRTATRAVHAPTASSARYPEKFVGHSNIGEAICVPRKDQYVTLAVATRAPQVQVDIGHPLTITGVGFPSSAWTFTAHQGVVRVTVPVNVVFDMVPSGGPTVNGFFGNLHGDLFGVVTDSHGSTGLLFYVGSVKPAKIPILSQGPMSVQALSTWTLYSVNPTVEAKAVRRAIQRARAHGWSNLQQVEADHKVIGYDDGWVPLRMQETYDLIDLNDGGSVIFKEVHIISRTPDPYAHQDARACPSTSAGSGPA